MKKLLVFLLLLTASACGKPGGGDPAPACGTCDDATPANPVILIHGRNDTAARWDTLVADWSAHGYTEDANLFRIDMAAFCGDAGFCSMLPAPDGDGATYVNEAYARCLARFVDEKVPSGPVDLVGHSQGVIVARYYARFIAPAGRVESIVAMSGPSNGIINCGLSGACPGVNPEDCPDSAFMRKLNGVEDGSNDETPAGPSYAAVVSDRDSVISPWCSGYFVTDPQIRQADDFDCRRANYTVDPDAAVCQVAAQHLVIPTDTDAIRFAYCQVNQ